MDTAEILFGAETPTRLALAWLRFFKIDESQFPRFHANLLAACGCHDWGKANEGFLGAIERTGEQSVYHEHLSALLISLPETTEWLRGLPLVDYEIVLSAVMCHHLRARSDTFAALIGGGNTVRMHFDHEEFAELVSEVTLRLGGKRDEIRISAPVFWGFRSELGQLPLGTFDIAAFRERVRDTTIKPFNRAIRKDVAKRRMLWAVRAGLIVADAAGSALPCRGHELRGWLSEAFPERSTCDADYIEAEVISRRVDELQRKGRWRDWTDFQRACDRLPTRSLLMAACGAGKTLAAWRWIKSQSARRPTGRVLFLYPTRATAKECFRDYV